MSATLKVIAGSKLPGGAKGRWRMTEILGCGGGAMLLSVLLWVGVIGGVVYLVTRLGREERSISRADDARQLADTLYARGEITAEELDVLRFSVQV